MLIKIYSSSITNRLQYTLDVVLKQLLGLDFQLISDFDFFQQDSGPKINYGGKIISESEVFIPASNLLFETDIKEQNIQIFHTGSLPAFYEIKDKKADLPFDFFAMTFYLISRYEEYLPHSKDDFGRYTTKQSLAYKNNFLQLPLVNLWTQKLAKIIVAKFPNVEINEPKYSFIPSYDIDHAWAYLHKGFLRMMGSAAKDLVNFDLNNLKRRLLVLFNMEKDPYFTFNYLGDLRRKFDLKPIYFFLLANWGKYDTNNSVRDVSFRNLIKEISQIYPVGIHPSFGSNSESELIKIEKERLEKITDSSISKSRQHFLILNFPKTYRRLIKNGITEDYSMGYASDIGFRASIAVPFFWFDLENNCPTKLKIYPFQIMDVTLNQYLKLSPENALNAVLPIIQNCKKVNGTLITLWHNSSVIEEKNWVGWRAVYEQIIEEAIG